MNEDVFGFMANFCGFEELFLGVSGRIVVDRVLVGQRDGSCVVPVGFELRQGLCELPARWRRAHLPRCVSLGPLSLDMTETRNIFWPWTRMGYQLYLTPSVGKCFSLCYRRL